MGQKNGRRWFSPWLLIGLVFVAGGASASAVAVFSDPEWNDPIPPMNAEPVSLQRETSVSALGLTLSSPADIQVPFSGEQAIATAWKEEGAPGNPTGVHATLALLDWGSKEVSPPVWVVTYEGAECVQQAGEPGQLAPCVFQDFHTLIDANTGTYIASFTAPESDSL
jgi:hypothetical protein